MLNECICMHVQHAWIAWIHASIIEIDREGEIEEGRHACMYINIYLHACMHALIIINCMSLDP